jgi:hypothetical protein
MIVPLWFMGSNDAVAFIQKSFQFFLRNQRRAIGRIVLMARYSDQPTISNPTTDGADTAACDR